MAKIRAGFDEKTGKYRWVPKVWHLTWVTPGGIRNYIAALPKVQGTNLWDLWDLSTFIERDALGFENEKVAHGAALVLSTLYGVTVTTQVRWVGQPAYDREIIR